MARGWRRLRLRRRIALLLAGVAFAATFGVGVFAYLSYSSAGTSHSHAQSLLGALLLGLLLTGLFMLAAVRVSSPLSPPALDALYTSLDDALDSAGQVDAALRAQLARATYQSATARHLMDEIRTLTDVANALEHGVALLRDTASQLYAGGASAPEARAQAARSVAVAASQIGGAAEQAHTLCQRLRAFTNQVIAEANTLGENGQQAARHASALAAALRRVEAALSVASTSSSAGLRAVGAVQGALSRVAAHPQSTHLAPPEAPAHQPPATLRAAVPSRRSAWQHTGRTSPRMGRGGRPMTHPHLQGTDALGASGYRFASGGPRPGSNHPSTSRHIHRPWYTDEPPVADAGIASAGDDQPTRPESASHPTPGPNPGERPGE
jgi:hypothetical protein